MDLIDREVLKAEIDHGKVGWSVQNLCNKMRRNNFSTKELNEIATALGCEYQRDMVPIETKTTQEIN